MLNETDPVQQAVDHAVIEEAMEQHERDQQDFAVLFNNAIVKAFSKKG